MGELFSVAHHWYSERLFLTVEAVMDIFTLRHNGQSFPVDTIVEINIYESYGNGFRAEILRTHGYGHVNVIWTDEDLQEANRLGIKTIMRTT